MKLCISICNVPCPEEYYMGVNSSYECKIIDIPDDIIPQNIKSIINNSDKSKRITQIAIVK